MDTFYEQIDRLQKHEEGVTYRIRPSRSGVNHHAVVNMGRALSMHERIAYQAALGGDVRHCLLSLVRMRQGHPHPVVFFESSDATKIEVSR